MSLDPAGNHPWDSSRDRDSGLGTRDGAAASPRLRPPLAQPSRRAPTLLADPPTTLQPEGENPTGWSGIE